MWIIVDTLDDSTGCVQLCCTNTATLKWTRHVNTWQIH